MNNVVRGLWKGVIYLALAAAWLPAGAQTVEYIHTDALGTPVAITNSAGVVIERSEYEPYGALLNRPMTDGPGFTGHVQDAATGLTYMQQRYYDPMLGIFYSRDPVAALSDPVGHFNPYRYANNNPYKFTDPDGRAPATRDKVDWRSIAARSPGSASAVRVTSVNTQSARNTVAPKGAKTIGPLKSGYVYGSQGSQAPSLGRGKSSESGTLQIGIQGAVASLGVAEVTAGIALDANGSIGTYTTSGVGLGPKEDANLSIVLAWSNANGIKQLEGTGTGGNIGGGLLGHFALNGEISDTAPGAKQIYSGGFSVGLGAGAGGSVVQTNTDVNVLMEGP